MRRYASTPADVATRLKVRLALVLGVLVLAGGTSAEVYYQNDFEDKCDIVFWASAAKVQANEIGLADHDPYGGKRCAKIVFQVLEGSRWCYFKIPIDVAIDPAKTYVVEAAVKYETSRLGTGVGFGHSWWHTPGGGKAPVQGNSPSAGTASAPGKWCVLQSKELGEVFQEAALTLGFPKPCAGRFDALYVHTDGNQAGDRVTVWVDDVKFRSVTDADGVRWEKEKHPFDYTPPSYREVEEACPWGVCGSLEGYAGELGVPLEVEAAVIARSWADFGFDTALRAGGMVMAPGAKEPEDYLGRFLDFHWKHGIRCLPSTYLTGYYNREVPRDQCEAAIRRVVTRYRDHPALLAWWMIDEPDPVIETVGDQWIWGKKQFESLDPRHPALGAFCNPDSVEMYSQYTQVALIDCYPLAGTPERPVGDPISVAKWVERSWARGARRVWAVPQAFGELAHWRVPTAAEVRLMTYLYLARDSTGFLYYIYSAPPAWMSGYGHNGLVDLFGVLTHMGEEVRRLAETVPAICQVLLSVRWAPEPKFEVECEKEASGRPVFDVALLAGKPYEVLIISNLDVQTPRKGKVVFTQKAGRSLYDLRTLKPATVAVNGAVSVRLDPGDAALFLSADAKAFASVKTSVLSRRLDVLKRGTTALISEAQANGLRPTSWESALGRAKTAAAERDPVEALARTLEVRERVLSALRANSRYTACREPFDRATAALSRASRNLEVWVLRTWPSPPPDLARKITEDPELAPHVKALRELARCQHLLRYALLTGKTESLKAAYQDLEALAAQAEESVKGFVGSRSPLTLDGGRLKRLGEAVAVIKP